MPFLLYIVIVFIFIAEILEECAGSVNFFWCVGGVNEGQF
jgi:hypothetical protein